MSVIVPLGSGPLGLVSNPTATPRNLRCARWLREVSTSNGQVVVPEIADYEVRRELLRVGKIRGLRRLDAITAESIYLPPTETMLLAAQVWADVRRRGQPTADPHALDADVILAAQATLIAGPADRVVVATTNPAHLAPFVDARAWEDTPPHTSPRHA